MGEQKNSFELPTVIVVFGITGDLMKTKLLPALYNLFQAKRLPQKAQIIGFSRRQFSDDDIRAYLHKLLKKNIQDPVTLESFLTRVSYIQGDFDDLAAYQRLVEAVGQVDGKWHVCSNKLYYLAVPPQYYRAILRNLAASKLTIPCGEKEGWTRVILEKPFGRDLKNAQELDSLLGKLFKEEQIYRVDHFLGKETVRNILAFRFSNSFLAPVWNNRFIEKIKIQFYERERVRERGEFYDGVGALRDVGQNHLLQLLAIFTMNHPIDFTAAKIRRRKEVVLAALKEMTPVDVEKHTIRGQYRLYHQEEGVDPDSKTETYFKIKTEIANPRWQGVSIYLEAGKAMAYSRLEVVVTFKHQNPCLCPPNEHYQNVLRYQIQPHELISMNVLVKKPGHDFILQKQDFLFDYQQAYKREDFVNPYEKLILDMVRGDQTLFVSTGEIMEEWRFVEPILSAWNRGRSPLVRYDANTKIKNNL